MWRLVVPPTASQTLASDLAGEIVADAATRGATCPELALATALVLQSMAHGIVVGCEAPEEAVSYR